MFRVRYSFLPAAVLLVMSMSWPEGGASNLTGVDSGLMENHSGSADEVHQRYDRALDQTWPDGTYGLPKPSLGCPNSQFTWAEGYRYHDTEDVASRNQWSHVPLHLAGSWHNRNNMMQRFCIKTHSREPGSSGSWKNWQPGSYCIFKYRTCPSGFYTGMIYWDDENTNNRNSYGGAKPTGTYNHNTRIYFCCREDGPTNRPIVLPTRDNFYLFPRFTHCQAVSGMRSRNEWFRWDNEDYRNKDYTTGYHPYEGVQRGRHNILLHYCYYY